MGNDAAVNIRRATGDNNGPYHWSRIIRTQHRKVARSSWLAKGNGKNSLLQGLHLVATRRISLADCDKKQFQQLANFIYFIFIDQQNFMLCVSLRVS